MWTRGEAGVVQVTADASHDDQAMKGSPFGAPFVYLGDAPVRARQIALVPGAEVPLLSVDLPPGLRGHAREQVAERQMRDALTAGEDLIEIRPFFGPQSEKSWTRVLVADRALMSQWRALAGKEPRAVLPDYLALPAAPGVWTLTEMGGQVLARLSLEDGFTAPPLMALKILENSLKEAKSPPFAIFTPTGLSAKLESDLMVLGLKVAATPEALQALGAEIPKALAHGELEFDLRRDPRAARQRLARNILPWRWPFLMGLIAAGLWAATHMLAIHKLEGQITAQRAATHQTVRDVFVPNGPVLDVRTQVSRALAQARVAASEEGEAVSPLDLVGLTAEVIASQGTRPEYLDYTLPEGLTVMVRAENFAAAEDLATALRDAGLNVTVLESSVSAEEDGVRTELRIAGTGQERADQ